MSKRARTIAGVTALTVLALGLLFAAFKINTHHAVVDLPPVSTWQTEFLHGYTDQLGPLQDEDEDDLVTTAALSCTYLENHDLPQTWRFVTDKLGLSSDQAATVIDEAVRTHCPQVAGAR